MRKSLWFIYTSFIGWLLLYNRRGIIRWEFVVAFFSSFWFILLDLYITIAQSEEATHGYPRRVHIMMWG